MRFSIKLKFFAAARIQHERGEEQHRDSDVNDIQHNFQTSRRWGDERDNAAIYVWVNLKAADFAAQRIALPIACEIS
jgi:hypothetical protein